MQTSWLRGALGAILVGVLHLAAASAAPPARGQEPTARPQGPGRGPGQGKGSHSPEQQADELAKKLKLNAKQKGEVAAIFKGQHEQRQALRPGADQDREQGMAEMRRLDADTDAKLQAVLTPAQFKQYQAQKPRHGGPQNGKAGKGGKGGRPAQDATSPAHD